MLPGVCYHGNPSGSASGAERVAIYTGKPAAVRMWQQRQSPRLGPHHKQNADDAQDESGNGGAALG